MNGKEGLLSYEYEDEIQMEVKEEGSVVKERGGKKTQLMEGKGKS